MGKQRVLLLGGSGFVGGYIAQRLSERGYEVTIPTRRRERTKALIMFPGVDMIETDIGRAGVLEGLIGCHQIVINLVGILHSRDVAVPYSRDFAAAHVDLPQRIVAACRQAGVRRLVHMSALKADPAGPSEYLASKGDGERAVLAAQGELDVTVFRPSVIFGAGDAFLNTFARLLRAFPVFPLAGSQARFQPVWAGDVADAFVNCLQASETYGRAYDLCGPEVYTLRELVELTGRLIGRKARVLPLGDGLAYLQAGLLWLAPKPVMSPDNLRSMQVDSVCDANCRIFPNWRPRSLAAVVPGYLGRHSPRWRLARLRSGG